jgi:cellulose 1,4-beta-cellobiosidase
MEASLARLRTAIAAGAAATLLVASFAGAQAVHADTTTCSPTGTIAAGDYTIQANEWNSTLQQCITYTGGTAWSLTTANFNTDKNGAPATYPSIYKGCHWGACTANSGLPIQVSKLTSTTMSWGTTQVSSGMYNVAADIWFNSTPTTSGQPDGTELMIWQNRLNAYPFGSQTGTASLAGFNWDVWTGQQSSWKIITYELNPGTTSFSNLDVLAIINDAVTRGYINSAHYLIDAEVGNEIWQGGQGLGTTSFAFDASSSTNPATPTPTSPTPSPTTNSSGSVPPTATPTPTVTPTGGSGTCSASFHLDNSWTGGFQATVTVTAGSSAITGWTANWTWPSGQSITNSWNAALMLGTGGLVSAANMNYNGALAAGGNTTFGLQGNGNAVTPTLSCTAAGGVTPSPTPVVTPSPTVVPPTPTPTPTAPVTPSPTAKPTATPTATPTNMCACTPTPKPSVTPSPTPTGGAKCTATYVNSNDWGSGFTVAVTVTNAGSTALSNWKVTWTWAGNQTITSSWNANVSTSSKTVTATNLSYNGSIAAGGNTSFGLQGTYSGSNAAPTLTCSGS